MTTQATYYIIRALVALVAIRSTRPAMRWQHGFWAMPPPNTRGVFR